MLNKICWIILFVIILSGSNTLSQPSCKAKGDCQDTEYLIDDETGLFVPPSVTSLSVDQELLHDRWYKRVHGTVEVHNAPNGTIIRTIDEGFNFVTVLAEESGWSQINLSEWVRSENLSDSNQVISSFTGVLLPEDGLNGTLAWSLVNLYPSPEPGAEPSESLPYISRYTRLNIRSVEIVDGHRWYEVGNSSWVHQFNVAKIIPLNKKPDSVETTHWISIDLYEQVVIAYENTTPVFATLVSTGLPRWPTYEGTFNIYFRRHRDFMSWGEVGDDFYSLEEVPWTMFFDEGRALHGAYWHDGFGYRRSHGCVNMSITDAQWMYDWVADYMGKRQSADYEEGPSVYVYSSDEYDS